MKSLTISAFALAMLGMAAAGNAVVYKWTWDGHTNDGLNHNGGQIKGMSAQYDTVSKVYNFEATMGKRPGTNTRTNAFWMVTSNGPNPKGTADELAIFYFDASHSTNYVTAYSYNGQNGNTSYKDGNGNVGGDQTPDRIASSRLTGNPFSNISVQDIGNDRKFKFTVQGSVINANIPLYGNPAEWDGVAFANQLGIWFHPVTGAQTEYYSSGSRNGYLKSFTYSCEGWLDGHGMQTVPEPATFSVLALGALALRRKRK